jgi:predicted phage tail protein
VRAVETVGAETVESAAAEPTCKKIVDTFAPPAPVGLTAVAAGSGVISLIWTASTAADLAGYVVFRAIAPNEKLEPIMSMPIQASILNDDVQPGLHYVYAVRAVDTVGNQSELSNRAEETAR